MTWEVVVEPCPTTPGFLAAETLYTKTVDATEYIHLQAGDLRVCVYLCPRGRAKAPLGPFRWTD